MPMTKAEKAQMDNLYDRLALRWPSDKAPEPMTLEEIKMACVHDGKHAHGGGATKVARGWLANPYELHVVIGSSNGMSHGRGNELSTRGPGRLFRTRIDALTYIKHAKAKEFAAVMGEIERKIEEALAEVETELV